MVPGEAMIGRPLMVMPRASACVAGAGDRRADVVGAVAGDVDDAAGAGDGAVLDQHGGEAERARDRGAAAAHHRGRLDRGGELRGGFGAVDDPPGDQRAVLRLGRPFEIGDRDLAGAARRSPPGSGRGGGGRRRSRRAAPRTRSCPSSARHRPRARSRRRPGCRRPRRGPTAPGRRPPRAGRGSRRWRGGGTSGLLSTRVSPGVGRIGGAVQSRFR